MVTWVTADRHQFFLALIFKLTVRSRSLSWKSSQRIFFSFFNFWLSICNILSNFRRSPYHLGSLVLLPAGQASDSNTVSFSRKHLVQNIQWRQSSQARRHGKCCASLHGLSLWDSTTTSTPFCRRYSACINSVFTKQVFTSKFFEWSVYYRITKLTLLYIPVRNNYDYQYHKIIAVKNFFKDLLHNYFLHFCMHFDQRSCVRTLDSPTCSEIWCTM